MGGNGSSAGPTGSHASTSASVSLMQPEDFARLLPLQVLLCKETVRPVLQEITRQELANTYKLQARDLRSIDPSFRKQLPTILARPNSILVNLDHIKAIIMHDRVFLFDPHNPLVKQFTGQLVSRLDVGSLASTGTGVGSLNPPLPFEFRALEAMLINLCAQMEQSLGRLHPEIEQVLEGLTSANSGGISDNLQKLLPLKKTLTAFSSTVTEVHDALSDVLNSDEDMVEMYLTTKAKLGHRRRLDQHQEIELLLETYLKQIEEVNHRLSQMKSTVQSTQDVLNIQLAQVRNEIIRFNLLVSSGTFALACGAAISAVFGMNLMSHMEDSPYAFYGITGLISMVSLSVFVACLRYCARRKIL